MLFSIVYPVFGKSQQGIFLLCSNVREEKNGGDRKCRPYEKANIYALYLGSQVKWMPRRLKVFSSKADKITEE